jgi:hypothetical protein
MMLSGMRFGGGRGLMGALLVLAGIGLGSSAQSQDLAAGKSGAELFAQNCTTCHRSARGLIKTAHAFSLNSFLRQHYTTNARSANAIANYLRGVEDDPRSARGKAGPGEDRKSSRRSAEPESEAAGRQAPPREPRSSKRRPEPSSAARPTPEPADQREQGRQRRDPGAPATAARTPESPAGRNEPPSASPASDHAAAWNPAMEALLPAPVQPAAPSGLEPGTPVSQPAFSSPLP